MSELWPEEVDDLYDAGTRESALRTFFHGIREKIAGKAGEKGYARNGGDGTPLYDFVSTHVADGGDAHALGEIIYKAVRYSAKHDLEDVLKIAAWAFLVWEAGERGKR